jgi:NAD-dependent dihydropyrimidine dehydrogenase PreA subunit
VQKNDIYTKALTWLGFPDSAAGYDYLKVVMTPEECELLLEFLKPATCQEVAKRLKIDEQSLQAKLDNFMKRGLLFHGKTQYCFQFGIHVFFNHFAHNKDENIPPEWWHAWREFEPEEMERRRLAGLQRVENTTVPGIRIVPDRLALAASPKVDPKQVLWYEDYSEILRRADRRIVVDCPCRRQDQNCDRPRWVCFYLNEGCTQDLDPKRESRAKVVTAEEAIAYSDIGEEGGLVHSVGNNDLSIALPEVLCNCCECCCSELGPALRSGRLRQMYGPSRYQATVDMERCSGCQECLSRCFFNAIELRRTFTSKKKKAHMLIANCMGCGSCVLGCKRKAITLELVRPPEFIPSQKPMARPEPVPGQKATAPLLRMSWDFFRYRPSDLK